MRWADSWPEPGVRFVERHMELRDYSGRMSVIETVESAVVELRGIKYNILHIVHWQVDEEIYDVDYYDKYSGNKELGILPETSVPNELFQKMHADALRFFRVNEVRDELESRHEIILTEDGKDPSRVTVTFKKKQWSGYRLTYRKKQNGQIQLIEAVTSLTFTEERARAGYSRIPRDLCEAAFDKVVGHFNNCPATNNRQGELSLTPQDAPK